ncbi:hypothetical protein [Gaetbulibacter aestuarii]|uniref:CcmD family protein n=1 Tax=Gaetbulibacter aestuarii TaxID=1502358 RepID=A0ABW7MUJ5_9FLAO
MKILSIVLSVIALGLIIFNLTIIDFNASFDGNNKVAVITILASLCVILMMGILYVSKRIEQKVKENK